MSENTQATPTITLSQEQYKALMERMAKLENASIGSPVVRPNEAKSRKVTVLFVENQPIIGFANRGTSRIPQYVYPGKLDPEHSKEWIPYVDVLVRNTSKEPGALPLCFSIPFTDLMNNADPIECAVEKIEEKDWHITDGVTTGRTYQEGTYFMIESGIIPLDVKGITRFYTVKLPDGTSVRLHERYVNIVRGKDVVGKQILPPQE